MIDLDQPAQNRRWRRLATARALVLVVVGSFLAGGVQAQVTVVNAGPEMVGVLAVRVDQPGVTVRSPEKERQVAPGTTLPVDVVVEWNCAVDGEQA